MLDLSLFRNRTFSGANTVMLLVGLAMFGVFFYVSLYMQNVLGYSPIQAGASFLPWTVLIILIAPLAGQPVRPGRLALARARAGCSSSPARSSSSPGSARTRPSGTCSRRCSSAGSGMAATMAPMTARRWARSPRDKAGVGSAVLNSMRQVGGSLGIARHGRDRRRVGSTVGAGRPTSDRWPSCTGYHHALEVATVIALAGARRSRWLTLRKVQHPGRRAGAAAAGDRRRGRR